jgi:flagellar FliL protein
MAATDTSAEAQPATATAPPRRRRKSLLIVVAAAVLALAALGGAAYWFLARPAAESEVVADAPAEPLEPAYAYLSLEPFVIHAVGEDGALSHVAVALTLELTPGDAAPAHYDHQRPRLRDAILRGLHRPTMHLQPADGRLSLDEVKQRAAAASELVLGAGTVHAVLIQGEY